MIKLEQPWRNLFKSAIKDNDVFLNMDRKNQLGIAFFCKDGKRNRKQDEIVCRYMHRLSAKLWNYHTIWISWKEFKSRRKPEECDKNGHY